MKTLQLELKWKLNDIKRWWSNMTSTDRWFLYMNLLFVFMVSGVPLLCYLFGIDMK